MQLQAETAILAAAGELVSQGVDLSVDLDEEDSAALVAQRGSSYSVGGLGLGMGMGGGGGAVLRLPPYIPGRGLPRWLL